MLSLCLVQLPNPALITQMYTSLGLLYLASVVEQAGYSVEIIDLRNGDKPLPQAEFYGFSCTTPEIDYAKKLAKRVKGTTIVGGGHASLLPEDCADYFDYVVVGEGEEIILNFLEGNYYFPQIIKTPRILDLDKIPFPAWHKVKEPFSDYIFAGEGYGKDAPTATIIASRGCPFRCHFCGNILRSPVTFRSVGNIIEEMRDIVAQGIRHFKFVDDNFTLHPQFEHLCEEIGGLNIQYIGHTRSDLMTNDKARIWAKSGCVQSGLGVESADQAVLNLNNKRETVEDHIKAIRALKSAGMRVKCYFITGLPGETDKTIELNKEFILETQPDKFTISTFTPYPGCAIYNRPRDFGIIITEPDWSRWWNFCEGKYNHVLDGQTEEQMWARYLDFSKFLKGETWKE